jgi:hypothetical protein
LRAFLSYSFMDLKFKYEYSDPEDWGNFAWTFAYCTVPPDSEPEKQQMWNQMMTLFPFVLPCMTCKKCCSKHLSYLKQMPATEAEMLRFLCDLRRDVRRRNVEAKSPISVWNQEHHIFDESDAQMIAYFQRPREMKFIYYLKAYAFLFLVIRTFSILEDVPKLLSFLNVSLKLSYFPIHLPAIPQPNPKEGLQAYKKHLIQWLLGPKKEHLLLQILKVWLDQIKIKHVWIEKIV